MLRVGSFGALAAAIDVVGCLVAVIDVATRGGLVGALTDPPAGYPFCTSHKVLLKQFSFRRKNIPPRSSTPHGKSGFFLTVTLDSLAERRRQVKE